VWDDSALEKWRPLLHRVKFSTFCCMKRHLNEANLFFRFLDLVSLLLLLHSSLTFLASVVRMQYLKNSRFEESLCLNSQLNVNRDVYSV